MNNKEELMMKKVNRFVLLFLFVLLLSSLACNFSMGLPGNVGRQDVEISPEDIALAATRAAEVAATAAVVADQAGQLAATAVTQEDSSVATAIAQVGDDSDTGQAPAAGDALVAGGSLQQKLANIQPDANGNFTVAITEEELNEYIAGQEGAFQTDSFSAQNIQIEIAPEHVKLTGDVTEPIALPLLIELRPAVAGGQLQFELLSASAGIFPVPDSMLNLIEASANSELGQALAGLPNGVTVQDAALANGVLTIFGHQN
jgi:hypothetical protein